MAIFFMKAICKKVERWVFFYWKLYISCCKNSHQFN